MTKPASRSLRAAIDAKCKGCVFDAQARGKWREQVADCQGFTCPLYDVRPVPRECLVRGTIDRIRVAAVHAKLNP